MSRLEELIGELKVKIIATLGLIDVGPEDIGDDSRLSAAIWELIPLMFLNW